MNLKDAELGDQYRVFVNQAKELVEHPTMWTMVATVIARKKPDYPPGFILGWKADTEHPVGCSNRSNTSVENVYVPSQAQYRFGMSVKPSLPVAVKLVNGVDGMPCSKCRNFYIYALPNQADGTLLCWACRNTW